MSRIFLALIALFISLETFAQESDTSSFHLNYAVGADLSFLKMAEDNGTVFKDNGVAKPGLDIFNDHGYDWIRLRLFHSPDRLPNDLEYTIELAQQAKKRGMKFLLDYHYADSWADPGKQPIPAAWEGLEYEVVRDSVYEYTKKTIEAFREAGVMPEMVQIGNEIRNGMMWPMGKLPERWDAFAGLLKAGIDGVDAGRGQEIRPLIMVHYDNGADAKGNRAFFENIESYSIPFDIIGLSYYPWWHGSLLEFRENLLSLMTHFDQDIMLVETAYNWREAEYSEEELAPYPETPQGQRDFLESVHETLINIPSQRIKGIFWWEPAVIAGVPIRSRGYFDDEGNVLPVIHVFDKYKRN
ncbi:MAG: glycosyl hydrolase 53 family protein [Gracilimonas sp.]|nr:glycosyl hydrolase 53 family protein [Gracilimonas sp.]